jgi:transposase, IS5 family
LPDNVLIKVNALIDWSAFRPLLTGLYKREFTKAGGPEPHDALQMFKAILLGQWHSLSDPKLEQALRLRIDFIVFCGLDVIEDMPDETTLCRFRNRLVKTGKLPALLSELNRQLQVHGLMVKASQGAVLDASLITSAARPKREIVIEVDNQGQPVTYEDGSQPGVTVSETQSADPDATWLKKGKKSHFGYRSYVTVDQEDGYVRGVHTAPANESEVTHFDKALQAANIKASRVLADKGYASAANRDSLKRQQVKSGIMHKAVRNKPLTARQKHANRLISKKRYIIEQCFGTMKRLFNMARASYVGVDKVNAQVLLKGLCMNLLKAANKITLDNRCLPVSAN